MRRGMIAQEAARGLMVEVGNAGDLPMGVTDQGAEDVVSCLHGMNDPQPEGHMASHIGRRKFIALLGGAAASWPLAARAQRLSVPVIGFLDATTAADTIYRVSAFRDGLKEAGFIDGHNVAIEFRWAENKFDRLPALAADLVQRQVAVIVGPNIAMRVVRTATSTIPIVFVSGGDPIESGLVTNLSRPGGNITGVSYASVGLQTKRLALLHELVPPPATIAWLRDPRAPSFEIEAPDVESAARKLGRQILSLNA